MQINVFEGARRIAVLMSAIAVIVGVSVAATTEPYVVSRFNIYGPDEAMVATSVDCEIGGSAEVSFEAETPKGRSTWVRICLVAEQLAMDDGSTVSVVKLPAGSNGKPSWNYSASPSVDRYKKNIQSAFKFPNDEGNKADLQFEAKRREAWMDIAKVLAITLVVFWLAVAAIGWIVRGFAGIPRGKDSRK